MSGIVITEICPYCRKGRSPADIIRHPFGITICTSCEQRHQEALDAISTGTWRGECSECGRNFEQLKEENRMGPGGAMACHYENGRYRMMCLVCDADYVKKRRELYGGTEFAYKLKLD